MMMVCLLAAIEMYLVVGPLLMLIRESKIYIQHTEESIKVKMVFTALLYIIFIPLTLLFVHFFIFPFIVGNRLTKFVPRRLLSLF